MAGKGTVNRADWYGLIVTERSHKGEFHEFILMALFGKGPLRYQELWDTFMQLTSHFTMGSRYFTEWGQSFWERARRFISRFGLHTEWGQVTELRSWDRKRGPVQPEFRNGGSYRNTNLTVF